MAGLLQALFDTLKNPAGMLCCWYDLFCELRLPDSTKYVCDVSGYLPAVVPVPYIHCRMAVPQAISYNN